jgi:hypothetical protein
MCCNIMECQINESAWKICEMWEDDINRDEEREDRDDDVTEMKKYKES